MKILLIIALVGVTLAKESPLQAILESPTETLKLYNSFKGEQHLAFQAAEDRMRFRLFRKSAEFVAEQNSVDSETAEFGLNFFSTMTESEKQSWLGFNASGVEPNPQPRPNSGLKDIPERKLWTNEGKVTAVKNQGHCGSCWTFGAVGGLETRYARVAGVLRDFAEKEYLDCVYEADGQRDGCRGGWMKACYEYSAGAGGRLAKEADYKYIAQDDVCKGSSKPDAMIAAKIAGNVAVARSEEANIEALAEGSLAVAFRVTARTHMYRKGIFKDTTCNDWPNHAVTAVGYTSQFVLVKNSWGTTWGDRGFIKFARNHHNCHLWNYSSYPKLDVTGVTDEGGDDQATDYIAEDEEPTPAPTPPPCFDAEPPCPKYWCNVDHVRNKWCRKTCGTCKEVCPSGTVKCLDGYCRHEHMC